MNDQQTYLEAEKLFRANQFESAGAAASRCVGLNPRHVQAHFLLGLIERKQNRLPEALSHFAASARIDPKFPEPHLVAGMTLHQIGQSEAALSALRQCLSLDPNRVAALVQLGKVLVETGDARAAEEPLRRAIQLDPKSALQRILLGDALRALDRLDEALRSYRDATEADPKSVDATGRMGAALAQLGRTTEAEAALRRTIDMDPRQATARYNLAKILLDTRRLDEAAAQLQAALQIRPDYTAGTSLLGNLLGLAGRVPEAIDLQRSAVAKKPDAGLASNLLLSLNYLGHLQPAEIFAAHREWAARFSKPVEKPTHRSGPGRLRIGYVSPNFSTHSVAYFIEPVLAGHDRREFEIFCYADVARPDLTTRRLQSVVEHWRPTTGLSTAEVVELITKDRIAVLVDLAGHTAENRMGVFAAGAAPVQVTYLGYPNTTGLAAMDFRVTDSICDPEGVEAFHTEKLVRIPGGMWAYKPPAEAPAVGPLPASRNGFVTFGSFNNLPKVTPVVLTAWAEILTRVPGSRLKIKSLGLAGTLGREYVLSHLTRAGIDRSRVDLIEWTATTAEHLALYGQVDIALDTFPYNGTTTTCEALWMGVPVVTVSGQTSAGRVGASLLQRVGLSDWTASDVAGYVALAVEKAADLKGLEQLRSRLRADFDSSGLTDGRRVAAELERVFAQMTGSAE